MNWIGYTLACIFLYGSMQFFIKLSSANNPIASSIFFITVQFLTQIILGTFFISNIGIEDFSNIKYGIAGGIFAAIATILLFLALENGPLSKVVPMVNMSLLVSVILGVIFLKETVNIRIITGIIFAIISIYLLTK